MTDSTSSSATTSAADAKRRRLLYAGVATGAALAGAGWAWWRFEPHGPAHQAQAGDATFFSQSFETPDGAPLATEAFLGKNLVLNFWATWCPPCIAELPMLNQFFLDHQAHGWQVLGLAVDQPVAVQKFLERRPVDFPIGMAGLGGTELSRSLGNLTGGLPFTVVFGGNGQVLHRKIGQIKPEDLLSWTANGA